eukprot:Amastigsp_a676212_950.p4 type:complete len:123 gc:universal Amastigsp_a676212_950:465-833(+)
MSIELASVETAPANASRTFSRSAASTIFCLRARSSAVTSSSSSAAPPCRSARFLASLSTLETLTPFFFSRSAEYSSPSPSPSSDESSQFALDESHTSSSRTSTFIRPVATRVSSSAAMRESV